MALPSTAVKTEHHGLMSRRALHPAVAAGVRDSLPVLAGVVPFAIAIGAAVAASSMDDFAGWTGSFLVWAGSAHLAAVTLLGSGSSWLAALVTGLAINARFAVYSATLSPLFGGQPAWFRWTAPHFLVDQSFALALSRSPEERQDPAWFRRYYLALAATITLFWVPSIAVGVLAGPVIPESWPIEFAGPAALISLLAPGIRNQPALAAAVVGAVVCVALLPVAGSGAVILAAVVGIGAGALTERASQRQVQEVAR